jgi:hypothetical protein
MKTIELNKNFKLVNIEYWNGIIYFDIDCGRFGKMLFQGDINFNTDSDYEVTSVDIELEKYDWEEIGKKTKGFLNNRNTKLICEALENLIMDDCESYGFDAEALKLDEYWSNWNERELAYFENQN